MKGREQNVLISIRGTQQDDDGQDQTMELTTAGTLRREAGAVCLTYVETEMTGMEGVRTTFRIEDRRAVMVREGELQSTMTFVEGDRSESLYDLGFAAFLLRVTSRRVRSCIGDSEGWLELRYSVEMEGRLVANHDYRIEYHLLEEPEKADE